jgi:hypothetical protein
MIDDITIIVIFLNVLNSEGAPMIAGSFNNSFLQAPPQNNY